MKKLIAISLTIGIYILGVWISNTNIISNTYNDTTTSSEKKETVKLNSLELIMKERFPIVKKKQEKAIVTNNQNIIVKQNNQTNNENIPQYNVPLSKDLQIYIYKLSKDKKVPYELILGVMKTESDFNPKLSHKNKNGSIDFGIMQINTVHKDLCKQLGITDLFDPYQNTKVGIELLANIYKNYPNVHKATMVYNMGEFGAKRNWKVGRGTTTYSRKVVKNINIITNKK